MQHLSGHPGVVTLKAVYEDADCFYLVMDLCSGGRLLDQMVKEGQYSEHRAANLLKELILVIKYCHDMGVVHRDIKPENLLLTTSGKMKLADFGLAMRFSNGLLAIGPRFGGAIDDVARYFKDAYDQCFSPYEFVESIKKKGIHVPAIGHRWRDNNILVGIWILHFSWGTRCGMRHGTCSELAEVCREVSLPCLPCGILNIVTGLCPEAGSFSFQNFQTIEKKGWNR